MTDLIKRLFFIIIPLVTMSGCASLPSNVNRTLSYVDVHTSDTLLGHDVIPIIERNNNLSGFHDLPNGTDSYAARIRLIRSAEKTLDLQYFIWKHDLTGRGIFNQLLKAADRGVRIRLLLDDFDTAGKEETLHIINFHSNIEIRLFNPFANRNNRTVELITDFGRINRRMHNKSITADNQATIIGGRNIGDEYFDAITDVAFSDIDVLAIGPVVNEVSHSFDTFWNSQWVYPLASFPSKSIIDDKILNAFSSDSDEHFNKEKQSDYAKALKETELIKITGLKGNPPEK